MGTQPGSRGEHELQQRHGTAQRAARFYEKQVLDHLNTSMREFITRQEMVFIATADAQGACDCSIRAGLPGFVRALDSRTLIYPEYRGNGVMASLGNITENQHIGLIFVDFLETTVGLHVNGTAKILAHDELLRRPHLPPEILEDAKVEGGRRAERWVQVGIEETYIHCSKHIPLLAKQEKLIDWGCDDDLRKRSDHFRSGPAQS